MSWTKITNLRFLEVAQLIQFRVKITPKDSSCPQSQRYQCNTFNSLTSISHLTLIYHSKIQTIISNPWLSSKIGLLSLNSPMWQKLKPVEGLMKPLHFNNNRNIWNLLKKWEKRMKMEKATLIHKGKCSSYLVRDQTNWMPIGINKEHKTTTHITIIRQAGAYKRVKAMNKILREKTQVLNSLKIPRPAKKKRKTTLSMLLKNMILWQEVPRR